MSVVARIMYSKLSLPLSMVVGCIAIYIIDYVFESGLGRVGIVTGWILSAMVVFQSFYQSKKIGKISFGTSAMWLGCHVCMGFFLIVVFMFHIGWKTPNGLFEVLFTFVFLGTIISGTIGLFLYRTLPGHFLKTKEELTFRRIPLYIRQLREKAEKIALSSIEQSESSVVAEYYNDYIARFFLRPKLLFRHVFKKSDKNLIPIQSSEKLICLILSPEEAKKVHDLADLAREKNDLDYQYTLKYVIKAWVFIHAPLAYSTIVLMIAHIIMIYAYVS